MRIDNSVYLTTIQTQDTYYDKKSIEEGTGREKPKYKVCADLLPIDVYPFFVSTKLKNSCPKSLVVVVNETEWEKRDVKYLKGISYLSATHIESLSSNEVISKMKDPKNGFKFVARLPDYKYKELKNKSLRKKYKLPPKQKKLTELALSDEKKEDIIKRWNI